MMLPTPLKCMCRPVPSWSSVRMIPGYIIGFAPRLDVYKQQFIAGSNEKLEYTVDALVKLNTFDVGKIYQLRMDLVTIVDKYWEDD